MRGDHLPLSIGQITDDDTFRAVAFGQRPVTEAVQAGDLRLDGEPDATGRLTDLLLTLAPAPAPAGGALQAAGSSR